MEMSQKTNIKYNNVLLYYGLYTIIPNSSQNIIYYMVNNQNSNPNIIYSMVKLSNVNAKSLYNMVLHGKSMDYLVNIQIQIQISYNRLQDRGYISLSPTKSQYQSQSQSNRAMVQGLSIAICNLQNNNINIITTNHD